MILKSKPIRFVIGLSVIVAFLMVDASAGGKAWSAVMMLIVCTLGVGLVGFGMLSLLIGTIICESLIFLFFRDNKKDLFESNTTLEKYIANAKEHGMSKEEISNRLISAGWQTTIINETLRKIYQ